jgi:hypothetical protein
MKLTALSLAGLLLTPLANAKIDITVHDAYARATPPTAVNSAVFTTLINHSDKKRSIVAASTPAANKVELHDVTIDGDVMKMRQVQNITIPTNGEVELKPGSLHIMLFDLKNSLKEGEKISMTLTFANGETQTFDAPVKKVMSGMKKTTHAHH